MSIPTRRFLQRRRGTRNTSSRRATNRIEARRSRTCAAWHAASSLLLASGSGSEVSQRNLPQHVLVELGISQQRFASLAFMPPYWATQRCQVDSAISRCRHTSSDSWPEPRCLLPSARLRMIRAGVRRRRELAPMLIFILPARRKDMMSHTTNGPLNGVHLTIIVYNILCSPTLRMNTAALMYSARSSIVSTELANTDSISAASVPRPAVG